MLRPVPIPDIPPYLSSVTMFEPVGNPEAEITQAVATMASALSRRRWLRVAGVGTAALTLAASAAFVYVHLDGGPGLGGTFAYPNFASLDDLRLLGNAVVRKNDLLLTPPKVYQVGGVWCRRRVNVARGFETTFIYGVERPNPAYGSDGLAFVVQNDRSDALGSWGGNLGYDGIRKSAAVEFEMIRNLDLGDPNENHVSLQTRFQDANSANHDHPFSEGFSNPVPVHLSDGFLHTVYITFHPPDWAVYVDDRNNPVVRAKLDLKRVVGSKGFAWVGLTAASGGWAQGHILHSWKLDSNSPFEWPPRVSRSVRAFCDSYGFMRGGPAARRLVFYARNPRLASWAVLARNRVGYSINLPDSRLPALTSAEITSPGFMGALSIV